MKTLMLIAVLFVGGCQVDFKGPEVRAAIFRKDENGGDIYKSRVSSAKWAGTSRGGNAVDRWLFKHVDTSPRTK